MVRLNVKDMLHLESKAFGFEDFQVGGLSLEAVFYIYYYVNEPEAEEQKINKEYYVLDIANKCKSKTKGLFSERRSFYSIHLFNSRCML